MSRVDPRIKAIRTQCLGLVGVLGLAIALRGETQRLAVDLRPIEQLAAQKAFITATWDDADRESFTGLFADAPETGRRLLVDWLRGKAPTRDVPPLSGLHVPYPLAKPFGEEHKDLPGQARFLLSGGQKAIRVRGCMLHPASGVLVSSEPRKTLYQYISCDVSYDGAEDEEIWLNPTNSGSKFTATTEGDVVIRIGGTEVIPLERVDQRISELSIEYGVKPVGLYDLPEELLARASNRKVRIPVVNIDVTGNLAALTLSFLAATLIALVSSNARQLAVAWNPIARTTPFIILERLEKSSRRWFARISFYLELWAGRLIVGVILLSPFWTCYECYRALTIGRSSGWLQILVASLGAVISFPVASSLYHVSLVSLASNAGNKDAKTAAISAAHPETVTPQSEVANCRSAKSNESNA